VQKFGSSIFLILTNRRFSQGRPPSPRYFFLTRIQYFRRKYRESCVPVQYLWDIGAAKYEHSHCKRHLDSTVWEVGGSWHLDTSIEFRINDLIESNSARRRSVPDFKFSGPRYAGNYSFQVAEQKLSRSRDKRAATMNPLMSRVSSARFAWRMEHKHVTRKLADEVVPRQYQRRGGRASRLFAGQKMSFVFYYKLTC